MKSEFGFSLPKIFIIIAALLILGGTSWFTYFITYQNAVLMEIVDSGSTNFAGWDLKVKQNGSGILTCDSGKYPCKSTKYASGTFPSSSLQKDLATTNLKGYQDNCGYSSSMSVDTLIYKNTETKGIDCYIQTESTPLAKDIKKVFLTIDA